MAVTVKTFEKYSLSIFLKRNIKLLIQKSIPNFIIKWLMKNNYTQLDLKLQTHATQIVVFVLIGL